MNRNMKKQSGYTLIELMVTVAVAIIVLAVGIPAYDSMMANNRAISQANMFRAALNMARAEALGRNLPVTLIATNGDWTDGWSVYVEDVYQTDGFSKLGTQESTENTVKVWGALETGSIVNTNIKSGGPANDLTALTFTGLGEIVGGDAVNFEFSQTGSKGAQERCFCVNSVGQIRSHKAADDPCGTSGANCLAD